MAARAAGPWPSLRSPSTRPARRRPSSRVGSPGRRPTAHAGLPARRARRSRPSCPRLPMSRRTPRPRRVSTRWARRRRGVSRFARPRGASAPATSPRWCWHGSFGSPTTRRSIRTHSPIGSPRPSPTPCASTSTGSSARAPNCWCRASTTSSGRNRWRARCRAPATTSSTNGARPPCSPTTRAGRSTRSPSTWCTTRCSTIAASSMRNLRPPSSPPGRSNTSRPWSRDDWAIRCRPRSIWLRACIRRRRSAAGRRAGRSTRSTSSRPATGNGAFAVGVRSASITHSTAAVWAGVGVVAESDPIEELEETRAKFATMLTHLTRL